MLSLTRGTAGARRRLAAGCARVAALHLVGHPLVALRNAPLLHALRQSLLGRAVWRRIVSAVGGARRAPLFCLARPFALAGVLVHGVLLGVERVEGRR